MKRLIAFIVGALILAGSREAPAQSGIPTRALPGITSTLTGTVVSSTTTVLVLRDDNGANHPFFVDNTSTLPAGLVAGTRVSVTFETLDGGRAHLVSVSTSGTMDVAPIGNQPMGAGLPGAGTNPMEAAAQPAERPTSRSGATPSGLVASRPATPDHRLPDTASPLPAMLVTATLAIGAAIALRWMRRAL